MLFDNFCWSLLPNCLFHLSYFLTICVKVASLGDFLLHHRGCFDTAALKLLLCLAASFLSSLSQVVDGYQTFKILSFVCVGMLLFDLQLYMMDLFLGRRFLSLGSNILNYVRLRAALSEVLLKMLLLYHSFNLLMTCCPRCSPESSCVRWTPLASPPPFPRSLDCAPCLLTS